MSQSAHQVDCEERLRPVLDSSAKNRLRLERGWGRVQSFPDPKWKYAFHFFSFLKGLSETTDTWGRGRGCARHLIAAPPVELTLPQLCMYGWACGLTDCFRT